MRNKEFSFFGERPVTGNDYLDQLPQTERRHLLHAKSWRVVFVLALCVLTVSLVALGAIVLSYFQSQQKYTQLEENLEVSDSISSMSVDWEALRQINPDVVAWVYVPNTAINYPVVQGQDNDYYLSHDFEGSEGWLATFGAIFMDYRNVADWRDDAYFFYGHHMNDGSMFAAIAQMSNQETFDNARTIFLLTPEGNFKLRSFSLIHCDANASLIRIDFSQKKEFRDYVQEQIDNSIVDPGDILPAQQINKVFCLATCDNYANGRYALFAYVEDTTVKGLARQNEEETGSSTGTNEDATSEQNEQFLEDEIANTIIDSRTYRQYVGSEDQ